MTLHVYILRCSGGSYYTGHTDNLEMRMAEHQSGECGGLLRRACLWSCSGHKTALHAKKLLRQNNKSKAGAAKKRKQ